MRAQIRGAGGGPPPRSHRHGGSRDPSCPPRAAEAQCVARLPIAARGAAREGFSSVRPIVSSLAFSTKFRLFLRARAESIARKINSAEGFGFARSRLSLVWEKQRFYTEAFGVITSTITSLRSAPAARMLLTSVSFPAPRRRCSRCRRTTPCYGSSSPMRWGIRLSSPTRSRIPCWTIPTQQGRCSPISASRPCPRPPPTHLVSWRICIDSRRIDSRRDRQKALRSAPKSAPSV